MGKGDLWIFFLILWLRFGHAQEWRTYEQQAQIYLRQNELSQAIQQLEKSVASYARVYGKNDAQYAELLTLLTNLILQSDDPARAEVLFNEVITVTTRVYGETSVQSAVVLNNLARLYQQQGNFYKAEPLYLRARAIYQAAAGSANEEYAMMVNNLATLYYEYGQDRQAEKYYLEAKRIFETTVGRDHPGYGLACNNLGALYYRKGQYIMATALLVRALNNREKALGKEHPDYANSLNNMAMLYQVMEDWPKAEAVFAEVKNIREKVFGKQHPLYASSCNNLAALYFKMGKTEAAKLLLDEALLIFRQAFGKRHPEYIRAAINMADLQEVHGNPVQAFDFLREAGEAVMHHAQNNFSFLSENERESFYRQLSFYFESFYSFALKYQSRIPELTEWVFRNNLVTKGLLLKSYQNLDNRIRKSGDSNLLKLYQEWIHARKSLLHAEMQPPDEIKKEGIDIESLNQQVSRLEKELALRSGAFREELTAQPLSVADIRSRLKADEALVDMVRIRYREPLHGFRDSVLYITFVIKPSSQQPEMVVLPEGRKMESQALAFYREGIIRTVTSGRKDYRSYAALWKPVSQAVAGCRLVYFVPDGLYHQINVETLYNPETEKYVADELKIRLLGNAADIVQIQTARTEKQRSISQLKVSLFGYPDYSGNKIETTALESFGESEKKSSRFWDETTGTITVLKGTLTEVNNIAIMLKTAGAQVKTFTGKDASEENIKHLPATDVLHIATHGFFWPVDDAIDNVRGERIVQNPLRRSGLVLAHAEAGLRGVLTAGEDGILYAAEVPVLSLENTSLVVLSACETGLGEIRNGEGVYGLQRSFRQAGARAVLMSLWPVSDEATMEMMTAFYKTVISGKNKHEALDEARATIRKKYDHPFYWGAFVLTGE